MPDSSPTRIAAGADVLAADVLVGGSSRDALDLVRSHSWLTLVASDVLRDDAEAVVAGLGSDGLASEWRARIDDVVEGVSQESGDHPALASAVHGNAAHLLTFDESLGGVTAGMGLKPHAALSVRPPDAFTAVFDAASLYETVHHDAYPGPDREPRA